MPSAVGYQPTLAVDLGGLQERITSTDKGSITAVQCVYVPADDLTDPAPATTLRISTVLLYYQEKLQKKVYIHQLIRWIQHQEFLMPAISVKSIIMYHARFRIFFKNIRNFRILLLYLVLMSFLMKIK